MAAEAKSHVQLLTQVGADMLDEATLDLWSRFMSEHESIFTPVPPHRGSGEIGSNSQIVGGSRTQRVAEFKLEAHDVYQEFTSMVERRLEAALADRGVDVSEFMAMSSDIMNDLCDENLQAFCKVILGATDFSVFSDIMSDPAKRRYYFQIMNMWRTSMISSAHKVAEDKEAK